jgi:hypothetical protein
MGYEDMVEGWAYIVISVETVSVGKKNKMKGTLIYMQKLYVEY